MSVYPHPQSRESRTTGGLARGLVRRPLAALATGGLLLAAVVAVPAAPASAEVTAASAATVGNLKAAVANDGARVTAEKIIDARTVDLTISSPAVGITTTRLLLPKDWSASRTSSWPTLYMLHGANEVEDYKSWTAYTDIKAFTASKNVLLALPSGGPAGGYSDNYNPFNLPGVPKWETYHTVELPQILERGYRSNGSKAVAGLSVGGYGALIYAARNPGRYKAAASYSGLTDILDPVALFSVIQSRLKAGEVFAPWGSRIFNRDNWVAHNPIDQAAKLKGTALYVSSGDGKPGPLDDPNFADLAGSRVIEQITGDMNKKFVARLKQLGVPVTANLYQGGYHYWNYWERELHRSWPLLSAALGGPTRGTVATAATVDTAPAPAPAPAAVPAPAARAVSWNGSWLHAIFG